MWFSVAVIVLWGTTVIAGGWNPSVLPLVVKWGIWTIVLYVVAAAAIAEPFRDVLSRVAGMLGYTLFAIYFVTMSGTYLTFLPYDEANPDLWPSVFLSVNFLGPFILTTFGCAATGFQRREG